MVNWDAILLAPVQAVFGERVEYRFSDGGMLVLADAVFDEAYMPVDAMVDPTIMSRRPTLGVRLSVFPAGFDPEAAQGDTFTVVRTGRCYIVKAGQGDGHGWAKLEANAE